MAATAPLSSPEKLRRRREGKDGSDGATPLSSPEKLRKIL